MIVMILISVVYYFTISTFKVNKNVNNTTLFNIKEKLLKYNFQDEISLKCIEEGKECRIVIDGEVTKDTVSNLFLQKPTVYTYDKNLDVIEYIDLEIKQFETYEVCFEYTINKNQKSNDMIVEVGQKVYIFNSIHNKPTTIEYLSDIGIYFDDKLQEVKDAF